MRDSYGNINPDEIDFIDFIEADPHAFTAHEDSMECAEQMLRPRRQRRWVIAASLASMIAIVSGGLAVWSPWRYELTHSFPDGRDNPDLTVDDKLVFGDPPARLHSSSLGEAKNGGFASIFVGAVGYFFAEPGASWPLFDAATGAWASFLATPEGHQAGPDMTVDDGESRGSIQGAPAVFSLQDGGFHEISFGPVDGWMFSVYAGGMSLADIFAFAEAVGVNDGLPMVDGDVIGTMVPVGNVDDYAVARGTLFQATSRFGAESGIVSVRYEDGAAAYTIANQPVPVATAPMLMLQLLLGAQTGQFVHDQPALTIGNLKALGLNEGSITSLVAWVEGGRLIIVTGPGDVAATLALAESVRSATNDEWAQVVAVAVGPFAPEDPTG